MNIVIAGLGEVGFELARRLSNESHNIVAIDPNENRLKYADNLLDIKTIKGSSTSIAILKEAGVEDSDYTLSVTSEQEINLLTSQFAKKLGSKKTIARVETSEFISKKCPVNFNDLGIDFIIYPEELAAIETEKLIRRTVASDVIDFDSGKLILIGIRIDKDSPIVHKKIIDIAREYPNFEFRIVAISRGTKTIIPTGNDYILPNDQIFIFITKNNSDIVVKFTGKERISFKNLMILGGSSIGRMVAKKFEDELNVKLIEANKEKSLELVDYLDKTMIIQGDGRDIDLLAQEGIVDTDAFVSVTEDSETNIITCLMAKHLGVKKTIALVDKADYIPLTHTIGIDALINKKLIAVNEIIRFIRKREIVSIASLHGIDADVYEFICNNNSPITKKPIKEIKFTKNAIIGGINRNDNNFIAIGDTQLKSGDRAFIFALPDSLKEIEKFFS